MHSWKRALVVCLILGGVVGALAMLSAPNNNVPSWVTWDHNDVACDDLLATLESKKVSVQDKGGTTVATSPDEWLVQKMGAGDVDRDGRCELVLLSWREGSFGNSRPFWNEGTDDEWTQHVFIVRPEDGQLAPVWMSSKLGMEVTDLVVNDSAQILLTHRDSTQTLWEWGSWGLSLVEDTPAEEGPNSGGTRWGQSPLCDATQSDTVTVLVTGDIIAHASLYEQAWDGQRQKYDFAPIFEPLAKRIRSYDVAVASQETILVHDPAARSDFPVFGTPEALGEALANAGYDVVCCATNHAADKGDEGVHDTLAFWEKHPDITVLGIHETNDSSLQTILVKDMRIALVDATESLNGRTLTNSSPYAIDTLENKDKLLEEVRSARKEADIVLCFLHVGVEYSEEPSIEVRAIVQEFADAGADAVICTHPHVVQAVETVAATDGHNCVVYWSLGNLVSHQTNPRTVVGGAAEIVLKRDNEGTVHVASHELLRTVSHFEPRYTAAYFLDDYTYELAQRHFVGCSQWWPTQ